MTARSPLRLRLALASFGVAISAAATAVAAVTGQAPLAILFAVITAAACLNVVVVIMRLRQGPRYQPGRDVPPLDAEGYAPSRGHQER